MYNNPCIYIIRLSVYTDTPVIKHIDDIITREVDDVAATVQPLKKTVHLCVLQERRGLTHLAQTLPFMKCACTKKHEANETPGKSLSRTKHSQTIKAAECCQRVHLYLFLSLNLIV